MSGSIKSPNPGMSRVFHARSREETWMQKSDDAKHVASTLKLRPLERVPLTFDTTIPDVNQLCYKHCLPFCNVCEEEKGEVEPLEDAVERALKQGGGRCRLSDGEIVVNSAMQKNANSLLERMRK